MKVYRGLFGEDIPVREIASLGRGDFPLASFADQLDNDLQRDHFANFTRHRPYEVSAAHAALQAQRRDLGLLVQVTPRRWVG